MGFFGSLFGKSAKLQYPPALLPEMEKAKNNLQALTSAHVATWHLDEAAWDIDQGAGTITFSMPNGTQAVAPVQIIGTFDTNDSSWLWSWANPSIEARLTEHARQVQAHGAQHGYKVLVDRKLNCAEDNCWELAALACLLNNAQGAYRGPAGTTLVFVTFGDVTLSRSGRSAG